MKKLIVSLLFIFCSYSSFSTHFMGGEITWTCITGGPDVGKYIFEMKIYRDCNGSPLQTSSEFLDHHNYPALGGMTPILMNFISITDMSPQGTNASGVPCPTCVGGGSGTVEEGVWRSDPITLLGSPPLEGWHFTNTQFARNDAVQNITSPGGKGMTLRAVMYPYLDGSGNVVPADPCFDSSPAFKENAKTIICTGQPFSYSHNATDDEFDVLEYFWAEPLDNWNAAYDPALPLADSIPYLTPYTLTSPIPGNPTLGFETGEISYNATITGNFVTCIKVEARKCGQLISEIYREVQVVLVACPNLPIGSLLLNSAPTISPPFPASVTPFEKNVYAGDMVTFNVQAEDTDVYPGGISQEVFMDVSGGEFSADFVNINSCANPPCATFNNGAGLIPPFSAPTIVNGVFEWQAHCDHLADNCGNASAKSVFTFSIKAYDDFCPANGLAFATIKITVYPPLPDLRCLSVEDNGDIELTWNYLDDAPPTNEPVIIWHSTNFSGPYTIIDSTFFPTETYTHVGANGDNAIQYYYLSNSEGCDPSAGPLHSDTLQSILLNVNPINFGVAAYINWNATRTPLLSTSSVDYDMFIKKSGSPFSNHLTTSLLSFDYELVKCSEDLQFYVDIPDASGCISKSSIGTVNLGDTITPKTPIITDVSVDSIGKAVISWTTSAGSDHYLIYNVTNQGSVFIDSVHGEFSSTYTYLDSEADSDFETFNVKAIDSCSNSMLATLNHNSIYLSYDLDECAQDLLLTWNEYNSWILGVSFYNLVVKETDLSGVTTIKVDTHMIDVTNYLLTSLVDKYSYNIYIIANDGDTMLSALSNQLSFITDLPKKPDYNYIEYASVNHDNGFVEINCLVDNTAIISHYDVMRSLRYENNFKLIGSVPFDGGATIHYTDESVKTSRNFYQYRIYPVDTCGIRISAPSFVDLVYVDDTSYAQTILLETEINLDYDVEIPLSVPYDELLEGWAGLGWENQYTNTLTFNEYDKWLGDVSEYRLYRSINGESFSLSPICTWERLAYPDIPLQFIDVVTTYGDGNGRFCYYIEAIEGDSTNYGPVSGGALSNVSCVSQTPIIFVPNTFTPNGDEHNEVFRPFTNFVSEEGYSFTIYNRSGSVIFSTNDPLKGWDGSLNGNMIQADNYIFQLQYINGVGEITKKTDIITLVR